jgi:hypothetical protein
MTYDKHVSYNVIISWFFLGGGVIQTIPVKTPWQMSRTQFNISIDAPFPQVFLLFWEKCLSIRMPQLYLETNEYIVSIL